MRVILLLVAACLAAVAQESRPFGLLPPQSPLAPIQEALLRGDAADARAAVDAFLGTAPPDALAPLAAHAALLRAAAEPVATRAAAMLGVATAYADAPTCEAAAVAGIAALLFDGPEVGELDEPLLPRPDHAPRERADGARPSPPSGAARERLLAAFLEQLERRAVAPDRDAAAIDHARRLLAQFPSHVTDWVRVRPCEAFAFPARIDQPLRLRFWDLGDADLAPDPTRVILPGGPPAIDVTLPANEDRLVLPALEPGSWLLVATGAGAGDRRAWPLLVSDLELVAHSHAGRWKALALLGGRPEPSASVSTRFDPRLASRTRNAERKDPDNSIVARSGQHTVTAPIAARPPAIPPEQEQRLVADLWTPQPVHRPGGAVRMRLCVRPLDPARPVTGARLRVVLWPRQPHELVFEEDQADVIPIAFTLPSSAPPGPVRAHVFDAGVATPAGIAPEPLLDVIAFTVQNLSVDPVQLLTSAPASWKPGAPPPRLELLGLFQRDAPAAGARASVTVAAGSFRQELAIVLDEDGLGAVTLGLDELDALALTRVAQIEITARLEAGGTELATASRRIAIAHPQKDDDPPVLGLASLAPKPVAGEPLRLAITGPAGEGVLVTVSTRADIASREATIGEAGRVEVSIPTDARWSSAEVLASTRVVRDRRLERRIHVTFAKPDAPVVAIDEVDLRGAAGKPPSVSVRVGSKGPPSRATVSVAVVDDRVLRFAGAGSPNPDLALRPVAGPKALRASSSAPPFEPAAWYAAVLGRDDRVAAALAEARWGAPPAIRAVLGGPLGSAAQGVGSIALVPATRAFEPRVQLDEQGRGRVELPPPGAGSTARTWRVIAVAIDAEGRSSVAEQTVSEDPVRPAKPSPAQRVGTLSATTTARILLEAGTPGTPASVDPPRLGEAADERVTLFVHSFPARVADAIERHLQGAFLDCGDHLAASIAYQAAKWGGRRDAGAMRAPAKSLEAAPPALQARLAALRELGTRDGYAWQRGEPTDFELTPLVLHALAVAADAGLDPAAFGAYPDMLDGFLRIAPRVFAEAHGNPQAALDLEDLRTHAAFMRSVPPERRAIVLVDTVIGVLGVDPAAGFAKLGVASLLRQTTEIPGPVLARAGLAMLRAGDRESAAIALKRLEAVRDEDAALLALHLQLARVLDAPPAALDDLAARLARAFTHDPWPPMLACALAFAELEPWFRGQPGTTERVEIDDPGPAVAVRSGGPAIVVAERAAVFERPIDAGGPSAPAVRLDDGGLVLDPRQPSIGAGSQLRIEVTVEAPGHPFAIRCPIAPGMRVLRAPKGFVDSSRVLWLSPGSERGTPVRFEAVVEVSSDLDAWDPVTVVSLDTLDATGWSSGARFVVAAAPPSAQTGANASAAVAIDEAAVERALVAKVAAFDAAQDAPSKAQELRDLLELPGAGVAGALAARLAAIVALVDPGATDRPAATPPLAALLAVLGPRRDAILEPAILEALGDGVRPLADLMQDEPKALELVEAVRRGREADLTPAARRLAALLVLARLRGSDPASVEALWDPQVLKRLWRDDASPDPGLDERLAMSVELPFQRHFARMFGGTRPVDPGVTEGWVALFRMLEQRVRRLEAGKSPSLVPLVAALTERPSRSVGTYTLPEIPFRVAQDLLRETAAARGVALAVSGDVPADLPLLTSAAPAHHVAVLLRALRASPSGIGPGVQILRRHREAFSIDDEAGSLLAAIAADGPRAWRLPAVLALTPRDRRRVPITVLAELLRDHEATSAAIELLVDRDEPTPTSAARSSGAPDSADLLRSALQLELTRREARAILDRLSALDPRPFARAPLAELFSLLARLDPDSARPIEDELGRRAEEGAADLARALASSREERVRSVLVRVLAKARVSDIPWEPEDPLADRLRTKLLALEGDPAAGEQVRQWMTAATRSSQAQGSPDAVLLDLWPALAPHATPLDVLELGAPAQPGLIEPRAALWTDEAIGAFLRSPEARPDPGAPVSRSGTVAAVVRLIGPGRAASFSDALVALWRAHVDAGLAFDALSLFGQMGAAQVAALREVLAPADPARFNEAQQLAYVAALARDPAIHREAEPVLTASRSPEIAAALARYTLEVTGYWKEPPGSPARSSAGPRTPQDWHRVLMTRIRNEGLGAVTRAEPPVLEAWQKTLRERGLLVR
jgi:hypothetical protein